MHFLTFKKIYNIKTMCLVYVLHGKVGMVKSPSKTGRDPSICSTSPPVRSIWKIEIKSRLKGFYPSTGFYHFTFLCKIDGTGRKVSQIRGCSDNHHNLSTSIKYQFHRQWNKLKTQLDNKTLPSIEYNRWQKIYKEDLFIEFQKM